MLAPFDIVALLRERTAFPARLIARLPNLKMIAMTGSRTSTLDLAVCPRSSTRPRWSPHLGFAATMKKFYTQSIENILAYLDGAPIRVVPR